MKLFSMDIETLHTCAKSVVLSLGFCVFDDEKEQTFDEIVNDGVEVFFNVEDQLAKGRLISNSTMEWWGQQGEDARRVLAAEDTITPREFFDKVFYPYLERMDMHQAWAMKNCRWVTRGPHFDIAIMDDLFLDYNVTSPWKYYNIRDIRTWLECHGMPDNLKLVKPQSMVAHNALHDAAFDAWMMQQVKHKPLEDLDIDRSR